MFRGIFVKKHNLSLTYIPKINAVLSGKCRQTTRVGHKFTVGDLISFHGWENKPYRSKWSFRTPYMELIQVIDGMLYPWGFVISPNTEHRWEHWEMDSFALWDGIDPPTGIELGRVLTSLNKIPDEGVEMQIIRW